MNATPDVSALPFDVSQWLEDNSALMWWLAAVSIASLVLVLLLLPRIVARLPADYFVSKKRSRPTGASGWAWRIGKNVLGVVFVLLGVLLLLLPGQGLLTLLIGLLLVDFPGKRRLELALVRRKGILKFLNRMREKRGKEPLRVE